MDTGALFALLVLALLHLLLCRGRLLLQFLHSLYCRRCRSKPNPAVHLALLLPPLDGRCFNLPRQSLHPVRRHEQSVLKLRRSLPIGRRGGPIVRPREALGRPLADHGLDREGVSRGHPAVGLRIAVVEYVGVGVKDRPDAVAAELLHRGEAAGDDVILDDGPDVLVVVAWFDEVHRLDPTIVRGLDEIPPGLIGLAGHEHLRTVSVIPVQVARDVDVDDIALGQFSVVGDAVANDWAW